VRVREFVVWAGALVVLVAIAMGVEVTLGEAFWNSMSATVAGAIGIVTGLLCIVGSYGIVMWMDRAR
jgi:hypothetical protein